MLPGSYAALGKARARNQGGDATALSPFEPPLGSEFSTKIGFFINKLSQYFNKLNFSGNCLLDCYIGLFIIKIKLDRYDLKDNHLARQENDGLFYWKKQGEVDIVVRNGIDVTQLIQVVYDGLDDKRILAREVNALLEAQQEYPQAEKLIITAAMPKNLPALPSNIQVIPLWRFLLKVESTQPE